MQSKPKRYVLKGMSMSLNSFVISDPSNIDSLKSALGRSFTRMKETTGRDRFEIYDTFDWRMYGSDLQLLRRGKHYDIVHVSKERVISGIDVNGGKERRFCWDFPASDFADHLSRVLEMRALIPVAGIEKTVHCLALCNADDKTVARIEVESFAITNQDHRVIRCRLFPIRGYGQASRRIRAVLKESGLKPATDSAVFDLLRQSGIEPGAYSSKVNVSLQPEMPATMAVQLILKNLVAVMHRNLDGVREDIDTEFLHDLRVAIRRGRSLIGRTKGVMDEKTTADLHTHLKTLGGISGDVRDLDVYLLKKEAYIGKVPETLKPGVLQLFRTLKRKRRTARDRMLKVMMTAEFNNALSALDGYIQSDPMEHEGGAGPGPVDELARSVIYKRFRRIIRKGSRISAETPDERLHELRIDCKKLRYLLEFFTSLFPADEMKQLIKQLKQLQDNLGDFNDLSVQQEFLAGYLATIKPQTPQSVMLAASTGGLIAALAMEHKRVRSEFLGVFEAFSSSGNKARFKALFVSI